MQCSERITCPASDPYFRPREVLITHQWTYVGRLRHQCEANIVCRDQCAVDAPILTEHNPAEMIGETVIDCRPSILPVSIPLGGLSPETISGARDCVSYLALEETGQSIMNMDTNEISINRIIGFAWNDGGTDVEDELPTPASSQFKL